MSLFDWCLLTVDRHGREDIVYCPSEAVADDIMQKANMDLLFMVVKYPTRRLV